MKKGRYYNLMIVPDGVEAPVGFRMRAWLFAIATNLAKNHFRSETRRRKAYGRLEVATREVSEVATEAELDARETGALVYLGAEDAAAVDGAVRDNGAVLERAVGHEVHTAAIAASRPRGEAISSPVRRKVGQCGRHSPHSTHAASSSGRGASGVTQPVTAAPPRGPARPAFGIDVGGRYPPVPGTGSTGPARVAAVTRLQARPSRWGVRKRM